MIPKHVLLIRFSALGDLALLLPVLSKTKQANPEVTFTLLTKKVFVPLFECIDGMRIVTLDNSSKHKGLWGLYCLYRALKKEHRFDIIVDLHQNIRTFFLKLFFRTSGIPSHTIHKRRKERKQLTARRYKLLKPLAHVTQLYEETLSKAGLKTPDLRDFLMPPSQTIFSSQAKTFIDNHFKSKKYIVGLAPFAHHPTKVWGLDKVATLVELFAKRDDTGLIIFGGKGKEQEFAESLREKYPDKIVSAIGRFSLNEEIELMRHLDVMLTMDSANMHLTNLAGTPTVSVWGATHPYAGFAPLNRSRNTVVQVSEDLLACRPCSVFGNKPCFRGDHACMRDISVEQVYKAMEHFMKNHKEK